MEVMAVCGRWILCVGALLASPVRSELSIRGCEDGSVDVVEGTDQLFTCGEYLTTGPRWTVYGDEGRELYSGSCNRGSCTPWNNQFRLLEVGHEKSNNIVTSRLTIKNITRGSARHVVCSEYLTRASCDLKILAPAILKDCDVYIRDWQVHATCVVEHMYSSDGRYSCSWRVNNVELESNFQDPLTEYSLNTRVYRKGVCSNIQAMPFSPGSYTYSIKIDPGVWNTVKTLNIVPPGDPVYTCSGYFQEGSTVSCKCTSSTPGTPPAEFFWNERSNDILYFDKIQREENGKTYTCSMTWGPNNYISLQAVLTLTVLVPVSIVPKTCQVQLSGWKVYGVCTIQWLDTINDIPDCLWHFSYQSSQRSTPDDFNELLSSSRFITFGSVGYKRRICSFEQNMPVIDGYYNYSISVSSHPDDQFSKVLLIARPGQLTRDCFFTVYEGSSMTCKCRSSYVGSPPAEFLWDEVNNETLQLQNIQRQDSGNNYTCWLRWGTISDTIVYRLKVITLVSINTNSCSVQLSGWNVSGVCRVQWLPSIKRPTCNWILKIKDKREEIRGVQSIASYKPMDPVYYTNCSFVHHMPAITGNYTYSIDVSSHPADQFSKSFYIAHEEDSVTVENTATYQTSTDMSLSDNRVQESIIGGCVAVAAGTFIFLCIKRRNSKRFYLNYAKSEKITL